MSTHNIYFHGEIKEISTIFWLKNKSFIWSYNASFIWSYNALKPIWTFAVQIPRKPFSHGKAEMRRNQSKRKTILRQSTVTDPGQVCVSYPEPPLHPWSPACAAYHPRNSYYKQNNCYLSRISMYPVTILIPLHCSENVLLSSYPLYSIICKHAQTNTQKQGSSLSFWFSNHIWLVPSCFNS